MKGRDLDTAARLLDAVYRRRFDTEEYEAGLLFEAAFRLAQIGEAK